MKTTTLLIFALVSLCFQKSEDIDSLIQKEYNKIEFVSEKLIEQVKQLKIQDETEQSIIHIGDSHVQIGTFFEGIKETIKSKNIAINDGWFYPAGLQKDYYHPFFSVVKQSKDFNIISIKTKERAFDVGITGRTFQMSAKKNVIECSSIRPITKIEFLHQNSEEVRVLFGKKIHLNRNVKKETTILSEDYAITTFTFKQAVDDFKLTFKDNGEKAAEFYAVRVNNTGKEISYSNFGVSGSTYFDFVNSSIWIKQLEVLKPNLIFVTLGTNDSYVKNLDTLKFKADLETLTTTVRQILPQTEFVFMSAPDTKFKQNYPPNLAFVNRTIYEHCKTNNLPFWNWNAVMGGYDSMEKWEKSGYSSGDWLHFSSLGYQGFGKYFVEALLGV